MSRVSKMKAKKRNIERDITHLRKTANNLAEEDEKDGKLMLVSQ